jgi:hypothetical protein
MSRPPQASLRIADEVWVILALLHRSFPEREDFSVAEIVRCAAKEEIAGPQRPGLRVHVLQHCVANRPPNPGRYCILYETSPGRRRLYRAGDPIHPKRQGAKVTPRREDLPAKYRDLLDWYVTYCESNKASLRKLDGLLALRGLGKDLWADEHADEYVRRLREGWE